MKPKNVLILGGMAVLIGSCIPSLYPLYHERDLIEDERLPGLYSDGSDGDYWKFTRLADYGENEINDGWKEFKSGKTYRLEVSEDSVVEEFAAHLLKLGDRFYLDFYPVNYRIEPDLLEMSLAPAHIFAWAEPDREYLTLHFFDPDWLDHLIEKDHIRISYLERGDRYVLTAETDELQKFIMKFANDSTTFIEADTLFRMQEFTITNSMSSF